MIPVGRRLAITVLVSLAALTAIAYYNALVDDVNDVRFRGAVSGGPPQSVVIYVPEGHFPSELYPMTLQCKSRTCDFTTDADRSAASHAQMINIRKSISGSYKTRWHRFDRAHADQVLCAVALESHWSFELIADVRYMRQFDLVSSYKLDSDAPILFGGPFMYNLFQPARTLDSKLNAIVYMEDNCMCQSGRHKLVPEMVTQLDGRVPVHSFGQCNNNMEKTVGGTVEERIELFSKYRFCVCMECSIDRDYVTEQIYVGLTAGCIPLYIGAPNVKEYLPAEEDNVLINFHYGGIGLEALVDQIVMLSEDDAAYEAMLEWKSLSIGQTLPEFQAKFYKRSFPPDCLLCDKVAQHNKAQQK